MTDMRYEAENRRTKDADTSWMVRAACKGMDLSLFFPERGRPDHEWRQARKVCHRCPVAAECLEYAMTPPAERFGIWSGHSERERRRLRTQRGHANAAHGTRAKANSGCTCARCEAAA